MDGVMSSPGTEVATVGVFGCIRESGVDEGARSSACKCDEAARFLLRGVSECSSIDGLGLEDNSRLGFEDIDMGPVLLLLAISLMKYLSK